MESYFTEENSETGTMSKQEKMNAFVKEIKLKLRGEQRLSIAPSKVTTSDIITILSEGIKDIFAPTNFEQAHKSRLKLIEMVQTQSTKYKNVETMTWNDWLNLGMQSLMKHHQTIGGGAGAASSAEGHERSGSSPVGTAYINLEELASQRSIDGTYDMIEYTKSDLSINVSPPYLSASIYLVQLRGKKQLSDGNGIGFGIHLLEEI